MAERCSSQTPSGSTQRRPSATRSRLPGLTLPGLANAHSHAFQRALRGRTHAGTGSFWTWREQMYELAGTLDPDACFALSRATFAEMALAGITCVGEFHYLHHAPGGAPYDDPNAMGRAVLAAAAEARVRITLLDACYLHGGIERFRDADAQAWAERVDAIAERPTARVGAAIHSVRAVDPESARTVAAWAVGRPLHAHVSEQPAENEECLATHGRTPVALLADAGALSERFAAVHATHLTDDDVALLGGAGVTVCLCPTTERDLADGIGPARRLLDAGASLATGSDSQAVIDPFEEARAIELDERLASGTRGVHRGRGAAASGDRERICGARLAGGRAARGGRTRRPHDGHARRRAPGRHAPGGSGAVRRLRRRARGRPRRHGRRPLERPQRRARDARRGGGAPRGARRATAT